MNSLQQVHLLTEELFHLVTKPHAKEERDDRIVAITLLLDKREQQLADILPPNTQNEKKLYEQILSWNEKINFKFNEIKEEIQTDLSHLKKTKKSQQQYVNPYANIPTKDGMFYDKRK